MADQSGTKKNCKEEHFKTIAKDRKRKFDELLKRYEKMKHDLLTLLHTAMSSL